MQPGITPAFEENLVRAILQLNPHWNVRVTPLEKYRRDLLRGHLMPLLIGGIVAGFMVLMVGMGLVGVLWQSVVRRTEELGVRRALGATGSLVQWQILAELLALTMLATGVGIVLYIQVPILQIFSTVPWVAYILAIVLGLVGITLFVLMCGLYPAWLATRVQPAEALSHE